MTGGREARSEKTRQRLLEATVTVIGDIGYEAATTRMLAGAAEANLSAIPYHFGGKKELYLAAARMIGDYAAERLTEVAAPLAGEAPPALRLETALNSLLLLILSDQPSMPWTAFLARCCHENDAAFALIHDTAIAPMVARMVAVAGELHGPDTPREILQLRILSIVTAIISFRFLRGILLRGMAWDEIQDSGVKQMQRMIHDLCQSGFLLIPTTH